MSQPDFTPRDLGPWKRTGTLPVGALRAAVYERTPDGGGFLRCIVGHEPYGWHLSISHGYRLIDPFTGGVLPGRLPTWDEIKEARYRFLPDELVMAQIMPPKSEYIDIAKTALHLWELPPDVAATFTGARPGPLSS